MSPSDKFELLAFETLEFMSDCLLNSMKESQRLAKINASLIQLAKVQRSGPLPPLRRMGFAPKYEDNNQPLHVPEANPDWQPALFQQLNRAYDLALSSKEDLEKSLELKNRENLELQQQLEKQQLDHEDELKFRDDRISQLSRQLDEKNMMKGTREVSLQRNQVIGSDDEGFRETPSIEDSVTEVYRYLMEDDRSSSPLAVPEKLLHENTNQEPKAEVTNIQDDIPSIPTSYPPIKIYPLGLAPKNNPKKSKAAWIASNKQKQSIFVGNLDRDVDSGLLEAVFSKFGKIANIIIQARDTYAFAFLTFQTVEMADNAKSMSQIKIGQRQCKVGAVGGSTFKVRVEEFREGTTGLMIRREFEKFGEIQRINFEGKSKAIIHFLKHSSAREAAAKMNEFHLAGNKKLKVNAL